ncbi:MAG: SRPBCC domain-containing protein [Bacteroidia bacterium]
MATKNQTVSDTAEREISITRILNAPKELVFEAWTDPKHLSQWWGPNGFTTTIQVMDVQTNGKWLMTMHGPDGTDYPNEAIFTKVVKPDLIVYEHTLPKFTAMVTFEAQGNKTKLTMCMVFDTVEEYNFVVKEHGAIEGQVQTINRFEELLAKIMDSKEVSITRIFNAPRELVWKAWTEQKHIDKWWGPDGFTNKTHDMDVRVGGKWLLTVYGPDGREHPDEIIFTEIVKPNRIVFKQKAFDCTVTISFEAIGNKTKLIWSMVFDNAEAHMVAIREVGLIECLKQTIDKYEEEVSKMSGTKELTITRTFNAPRQLVWNAWTDQEHIEKWWGPKGFTNPVCQWDAKTGGKINIHMQGPDGSRYPMDGEFIEIKKPERIVFISAALDKNGNHLFEVLNTISFIEEGNKTKVNFHFTFSNIIPEAAPHIGGANEGWNMSLDKLAELLKTIK